MRTIYYQFNRKQIEWLLRSNISNREPNAMDEKAWEVSWLTDERGFVVAVRLYPTEDK